MKLPVNGKRRTGDDSALTGGILTENKMDDRSLIQRLKTGDQRAVHEIVDKYKGPLFAFILRMIDDHADAEDIFQETWIRVIRHIDRFRGDAKFSTWLFQIARNLCIDAVRTKKRGSHVPIEEYENTLSCEPAVDAFHILRAQQVREAVNSLPMKMRETVILRYFNDFTEDEISEVLGCPAGTVKSRLHRAVILLRKKKKIFEHVHA